MKKLLIITIFSTILLWIINIFVYYLFDYPNELDILKIIRNNVEWKPLLLIYLALIFISIVASLLFYKHITFVNKFYKIMISFNIIGMIIMSIYGINRFVENKNSFDEILTDFRKDAEKDIKEDNVKIFGQGLPLPPKTEKDAERQKQIEKVRKVYGLSGKNLGCIISYQLTKAQEEYVKITDEYLEKRNGKGWRLKMKNQIDSINKNYR